MRTPVGPAIPMALLAVLPGQAADPPEPAPFALIQAWAGPDAASLGFTQERLSAFLKDRRADLTATRHPEWSEWLKGLAQAKRVSLKAWALARRVEAGDYGDYIGFQDAITEHLIGISKPGSGRTDKIITDPPKIPGFPMPDALRIDHESVFWRSFRKTLQAVPDRELSKGMYAVWCFGTHPDQKDLILELAARVQAPATLQNPLADPWNDSRFWIVVDWALAWGMPDDFAEIRKHLPEGLPKEAFDRVLHSVEEVPGFFSGQPVAESGEPPVFPGGLPATNPARESPPVFESSQIKVKHQPSPPQYPREARARKLMTNLVLKLTVDPQGKPVSCRPVPGPWLGFFAPTGTAYGMRWTFVPAQFNGTAVHASFRLTMPFRLKN